MMPTNNIDIVCTGDLLGHLGIWLVQVIKFLIVQELLKHVLRTREGFFTMSKLDLTNTYD